MYALAWLLAALGLPMQTGAASSTPGERIAVGESVSGLLESGAPAPSGSGLSQRFELAAGEGPVTITLESYDFDALLRVENGSGELLAEDDDGGVETNARLVLAEVREGRCWIVASSKEGGGEFELSTMAGDVPRPAGAALLDAGIAFHSTAAERALGRGDKKAVAAHRLEEGNRRYSRSQFRGAETAYQSCLAISREIGDRAHEARALGGLGVAYVRIGDYPKAREHQEQSLVLSRELGDRAAESRALTNLGNLCSRMGEYEKAREHHEQCLVLSRELADRELEASVLGNLAIVYSQLGENPRALSHYEQMLALARELADRPLEARALWGLGNVSGSLGDYAKARGFHERCLALSRELGDRTMESSALTNLGIVDHFLGDYAGARECCEQGLALARDLGDREKEGTALGALGLACSALGEYTEALGHHERHLALARELGNREGEASALGGLGDVYWFLGEYVKARQHHEQELSVLRELGDVARQAEALGSLGNVYQSMGEGERAQEHYETCLALMRELGDRRGEAEALCGLGTVQESLGDYQRALEHYEWDFALVRELGDEAGEATALGNLASVYLHRGDRERAHELAQESGGLAARLGRKDVEANALVIVARACLELSDPAGATAAVEEAGRLIEQLSRSGPGTTRAGGLRSRFADLGVVVQDLTALRASEADDDTARASVVAKGFADAGRWKGRSLLEGIAEHRAGGRSEEAIRLRRERRGALASRDAILERVSQAIQDGRASSEVEELRVEACAKLEEAEDLARRLREASPQDAALDLPLGISPEEVRRAVLGPGTLLVEYVEGEKRLYAYVLDSGSLAFLDLGEREEIAAEVEGFLSGIRDGEHLAGADEVGRTGRSLFKRLLAPALEQVEEPPERLVIVPSASLAGLPFEALVVESASEEPRTFADLVFVLDRYELTYAPSSPVLVELASEGTRRSGGKVLLLADPLYASESSGAVLEATVVPGEEATRALPDPAVLPRLPGTRDEALAIATWLLGKGEAGSERALDPVRAGRSGTFSSNRFDLFLGAEASRARLAAGLRGYAVLHLACHGFVDREFPQMSGIALASSGADDGCFRIADALELDLDADLVVLSACDTAQGKPLAGEGIESLGRAFLYAGARAVVASHWQLADWAAAETMKAFYRGMMEERLSSSRALRQAKLALRGTRAQGDAQRGVGGVVSGAGAPPQIDSGHPFLWAPLIHIGLGR